MGGVMFAKLPLVELRRGVPGANPSFRHNWYALSPAVPRWRTPGVVVYLSLHSGPCHRI